MEIEKRFLWKKLGRSQKGAVAVEFGLVITLFLLIVGAVIDFGHFLYLRQVVTNASREGARFGSLYTEPRTNADQIRNYIQSKYGTEFTVEASGAGGASGTDLTVTVKGSKQWFLLDKFICTLSAVDAFQHPAGVTMMKLE